MATNYKTPGVYIQEPDSFPPSIVGVETAVPAFIGYTQFATDNDKRNLSMIPRRIESMAEFEAIFGGGYAEKYYLTSADVPDADQDWGLVSFGGSSLHLVEMGKTNFNLYNSMRLFYANGGGSCYICSCGTYDNSATGTTPVTVTTPKAKDMTDALDVVGSISGPTMLVIPDAVRLAPPIDNYNLVAVAMLKQCKAKGDRMALLDVYGTESIGPRDKFDDTITAFRNGLANAPTDTLRYGAAYFPSLVTSVVQAGDLDMSNFDLTPANKTTLVTALNAIVTANYSEPPALPAPAAKPSAGGGAAGGGAAGGGTAGGGTTTPAVPATTLTLKGKAIVDNYISQIGKSVSNATLPTAAIPRPLTHRALTDALVANVPGFSQLLSAIAATQGVLPPSGAMAGVWTNNDVYSGVWNAPANTGIAGLIGPSLPISDKQQEDLNVPSNGLAVNAIRSFQGRGSLIWGARTLDGLSNDWRYIQVRRTMIYVEQSVKDALERQVFKPNTAQTWVTVTSMIESFLHGVWAAGGLMGSAPSEAYSVLCGMGSTMTPDDVLNGIMRVQITLQMIHPAQFMEITFKQHMLDGA